MTSAPSNVDCGDNPPPKKEADAASGEHGAEEAAQTQPDATDLEELLGVEFEAWLRHFGAC